MSNRFKFRAWHEEDQKMLVVLGVSYGVNLETDCTEIISIDCAEITDGRWKFAGADHDADEVILMQSTGLKDKNGVDIFEGDLISMYGEKDPRDYFEVEWNDDMLALVMYRDNSIEFFGDHNSEDLEVIGNIHDNPELMEIK